MGKNNSRKKVKIVQMHYNNENSGSNCHEYNCHNVVKFGPKNRLILILFVIYFTGIIWELYDLMMNTNINFPGTLKTSLLFLEQH